MNPSFCLCVNKPTDSSENSLAEVNEMVCFFYSAVLGSENNWWQRWVQVPAVPMWGLNNDKQSAQMPLFLFSHRTCKHNTVKAGSVLSVLLETAPQAKMLHLQSEDEVYGLKGSLVFNWQRFSFAVLNSLWCLKPGPHLLLPFLYQEANSWGSLSGTPCWPRLDCCWVSLWVWFYCQLLGMSLQSVSVQLWTTHPAVGLKIGFFTPCRTEIQT